MIFGITNQGEFKESDYRKSGNLQSLKKEIANNTNERLTFLDIYELTMEKCRIVAFQIPPAMPWIPTIWNGAAWARENKSLAPLPMNKVDLIRSQVGMDWSKEIVKEATIDDLDSEAVAYARKMFFQKQEDRKLAKETLSGLSDIDVLNKAGICFKGMITRTALLLLGKKESAFYFDGFTLRITWTLYDADKTPETIEKALEPGYKPPYYRNAFLCNAMKNMYMIDTNSMGIPIIYNIQKARGFPLPSYDLDVVNRVRVTERRLGSEDIISA